jgi:hypothetical protein
MSRLRFVKGAICLASVAHLCAPLPAASEAPPTTGLTGSFPDGEFPIAC